MVPVIPPLDKATIPNTCATLFNRITLNSSCKVSNSECGQKLKITVNQLYDWEAIPTFMAYKNLVLLSRRSSFKNGVFSLKEDVIEAFKQCLNSNDDRLRLEAAKHLNEIISNRAVGNSDPRKLIASECYEQTVSRQTKVD